MVEASRGVAMLLLILSLAVPAVAARDLGAPLPPILVQAESTAQGVLVSWQAPFDDGGHPIESYTVYRLNGLGWEEVATVAAPVTTALDHGTTTFGVYQVIASNDFGSSPPSDPALTMTCEPAGASVDLDFPFVHAGINEDCLDHIIRVEGFQVDG